MSIKYVNLNNRTIIYIKGADRKEFLQGLITNDVNNIAYKAAIYAVMLNPQGRFLYDFFVTEHEENLLLITSKNSADELIKKLSFYKLRAKVEIGKVPELEVVAVLTEEKLNFINHNIIHFADPRNLKMGYILLANSNQMEKFAAENNLSSANIDLYNYQRIMHKIIDDNDLTFDHSLILEYGFEGLNAIDYNKGCYIGQEVTARTHYRGTIRKKVFVVEIENSREISKGTEINEGDKKAGVILSSVFWNEKLFALALIKNVDNNDAQIDLESANLTVSNDKMKVRLIEKNII